jgi:Fe-S cluster assembly protein SufD
MNIDNQTINAARFRDLFEKNRILLEKNDTGPVKALREQAISSFGALGLPHNKLETWRNTDLKEALGKGYDIFLEPKAEPDAQRVFRCNIPHLDTAVLGQLNGWYVSKDVPLMRLGNGMIMGSLAEAIKEFPELTEQHLGKYISDKDNGFAALNTAFLQDGIFIYVPDNVKSPKPVQLINVIHANENLFLQSRILIVLGNNSRLSIVHCDDSYNHQASFSNIVTEVKLGENAFLDHYKLQNLNNDSTLISSNYFSLDDSAKLESHFISLNGGLLRNNVRVTFDGPGGDVNIYGLYLMDRKQHIDNHVYIDHAHPHCTSSELFKGILDEQASGVFNGHVLVRQNAVKTNAYQSNKNILMTETARVNSKPFLEIYNDDVKCSHGSSTGQLDAEAMFYLRQRAIGEESARMLLLYAFAEEVIGKIDISPLRYRVEDMVKKRLQGELQICEQCVLHCNSPDHVPDFKIDLSKI